MAKKWAKLKIKDIENEKKFPNNPLICCFSDLSDWLKAQNKVFFKVRLSLHDIREVDRYKVLSLVTRLKHLVCLEIYVKDGNDVENTYADCI